MDSKGRILFVLAFAATGGQMFGVAPFAHAEDAAPGEPRSLADLAPTPIPDEQNAAAQMELLADDLRRWDGDNAAFYQTPLGQAYEQRMDRGEPPTDEQASAMREILDKYAELNEGLRRAAACEAYASRGDFSGKTSDFLEELLTSIQRFRSSGRFLAWQIQLLSVDGKHNEAVRRGIELLRLARLHENEPTMVAYLVAAAVRSVAIHELADALAAGTVAFNLHSDLDRELSLHDDPQRFTRMFRTERAFAMSASSEQVKPLAVANLFGLGPDYRGVEKYMDAVIAASQGPADELRQAFKPGGKLAAPTGFGALADNLVPAAEASVRAHHRDVALVRSLRIYNALRLFAKMNKREATGLADLHLPREATIDPFSGEPLLIKHAENRWRVYSVGENGIDDGGAFAGDLKDYGVGPRKKH
jgi:hypothetical protein